MTRRRFEPRTDSAARSISPTICAAASRPRSGAPRRSASSRTDSATSPKDRGSSESTSAPTGQADSSCPLETAHTAQRSCVTIRSGASASISSASTRYRERPSRTEARTASSISRLDVLDPSILAAVTTGLPITSGGQRHSPDTPTSESMNPNSAIISVALGRNEQIRISADSSAGTRRLCHASCRNPESIRQPGMCQLRIA